MIKVAVVILNWNGEKLLKRFLPSVVNHTPVLGNKVIVVDNASTDDSVPMLKDHFKTVELVELDENFGFAGGYNQALQRIEAEYFLLLNSDVEVTCGWLQPMVDLLDKNEDIAAVQPKILAYNKKNSFEYAGASGGFIDSLGTPFCRGRILDTLEEDRGQYNANFDVFWASGACMLVRSTDFLHHGGFDSSFFAHMEEIDFCWRLRSRGRRIVCCPKSIVYHVGGATLNEGNANKVYLNVRNNLFMLFKNLKEDCLKKTIKKRIFYNKIAALKYCLTGHKEKSDAIHRAHKDFKAQCDKYLSLRTENMDKAVNVEIPEMYQGNIILDYYWRKIKSFTDIQF